MRELWDLFFTFSRVGLFTFGGGYAMIPMLQKEVVSNKGWITEEELLDYYAISQCTPGVIAVNAATFIGHRRRGFWGGLFATAGVVFPSFVIISILAVFIHNFSDIEWVQHAFSGIRAAVCALILSAAIRLVKAGVRDAKGVCIFVLACIISFLTSLSPIYITLVAALVGILFKKLSEGKT